MAQFTEIGAIAVIKNLTDFNAGMGVMRKQMGITGSSARSFSKNFNSSMSGIGQSVLNAGRTIRGFGNELVFLGFQLTFLATGAFAAVTQKGVEFEATMVRMATLANTTTAELGGIADALLRLAPAVGTSATELADAFFDIVSSGFTAAEAMEIIEVTAQGAALGLGDVRTVTDAVTSAMKSFQGDNLSAARAMDILVQAVREGKGEVDAMAGSIGRVTGIAGEMGLSFEEVTAFIATFTRVGVPAEVAITSLRAALTNILKPTEAAKTALEKYGLTMDNIKDIIADPNQGFQAALFLLASTFEEDAEGMSRVIGTARGLAGVLQTTGPLLNEYKQVLASIGVEANQTANSFALLAQTTEFKLNAAKAAFESLFITVSNTLKPIINLILDQIPRITAALEEMVRARPALFLVAAGLGAIVAAAGPLLIIVGLTITSLGTAISVVGAFGVALGGLLNPIGFVIIALSTLAAGITASFIASFQKTQRKLNEQGRALSFSAYQWGRNIIISFGRGMAAVVGYVIQVLINLGKAIRTLLRANSPPKLLPELEDWGKAAMESYMAGWLKADFGIFQNIASTIESFLRSLNLPDIKVVPTIMALREQLAIIIDQFRKTGKVASEAITAIVAGFGEAGAVVGEYIRAMLRLEAANKAVSAAQEKLNEAQAKFDAMLKPVNDELEAISRRRQDIADKMREEELQAIVDDENAPALAKELALMELREIQLKRQARAIEDQKEEQVGAAEEALSAAEQEQKAAEERAEALRQFIQVQEQNNALIREQIELLKRLADAMSDVGGGVGGIDTGAEDLGVGDIDPISGGLAEEATAKAARIAAEVEDLMRRIGGQFGPDDMGDLGLGDLSGMFSGISQAAMDLAGDMESIAREISTAWQPVLDLGEELTDVWSDIFTTEVGASPLLTELKEFFEGFDPINQTIGEFKETLAPLETVFLALFSALSGQDAQDAGQILTRILDVINDLGVSATTLFTPLINLLTPLGILKAILLPLSVFGDLVNKAMEKMSQIFGELMAASAGATAIIGLAKWALEQLFGASEDAAEGLDKADRSMKRVRDTANPLVEALTNLWTNITTNIPIVKQAIIAFGIEAGLTIKNFVLNAVERFKELLREAVEKAAQIKKDAGKAFEGLKDALVGEEGFISQIKTKGVELFTGLKDQAIEVVGGLQAGIDLKFQEFLAWVGTQVALFQQVGRNIGQGLLDGIMEALGPLITLIETLIQELIAAAEGPEGSDASSPSKKMIEVARNMMLGLEVGFLAHRDMVAGAMRHVISNAISEAHSVGASVAHPSQMGTVDNSRSSTFGPIIVNSVIDYAQLVAMIRQEMNNAL